MAADLGRGSGGVHQLSRGTVRREVAFLERGVDGRVYTPVQEGRADWPHETFGDDVADLRGVRARIISLAALRADKPELREDPKGRGEGPADTEVFARLRK
jgi:hypothetical protein